MQFINEVYCDEDPNNLEVYVKKLLSTKSIFDTVTEHTSVFDKRTAQSFARWCSNNRLSFLKAKENRNGTTRERELYVMDDIYYDDLLDAICNYLPNYQESIRNLKRNDYEIIGYARKSPSNDNLDTRVRLLQTMVNNLRDRSFTSRIYVSTSSYASVPFSERDLKTNDKIIEKLNNITGNTQDMLKYLQSVKHDVCLVSIDFAGLTTRTHDMKKLIENNPVIKKIAIETFTVTNELFLVDSDRLISDAKLLEKFNCRKKPLQRSK